MNRCSKKRVNIGCGATVITSGWINLDYKAQHPSVVEANLIQKLPFESESVDIVYSSHFIEHIPKHQVESFFAECHRILKKGGQFRFVVPDFEYLCREYLHQRDNGDHEKANFAIMQILDQCVRQKPGGELGSFYKYVSQNKEEIPELVDYIYHLSGRNLQRKKFEPLEKRNKSLESWLDRKKRRARRKYISVVTQLLPAAFREQNLSFCEIGEKHAWMWDFWSLSNQLCQVGFSDIRKATYDSTYILGESFKELDVDYYGNPRKGQLSLFIEGIKPDSR
jgi:predicted SAM-dependent methyltransferase